MGWGGVGRGMSKREQRADDAGGGVGGCTRAGCSRRRPTGGRQANRVCPPPRTWDERLQLLVRCQGAIHSLGWRGNVDASPNAAAVDGAGLNRQVDSRRAAARRRGSPRPRLLRSRLVAAVAAAEGCGQARQAGALLQPGGGWWAAERPRRRQRQRRRRRRPRGCWPACSAVWRDQQLHWAARWVCAARLVSWVSLEAGRQAKRASVGARRWSRLRPVWSHPDCCWQLWHCCKRLQGGAASSGEWAHATHIIIVHGAFAGPCALISMPEHC